MYEYEKQSYNESVMMMNESGQPVCAQCGAAIFPGAGFCRVCGAPVVSRAGAVPLPPMPQRAYPPSAPQRKASSSSPTFIGIGCAVFLIGVFMASFIIVRNIQYRNILDRMVSRDVRSLADDFFKKLDGDDFKGAYAMFDAEFRVNVHFSDFNAYFFQANEKVGRVKKRKLKSVSRNILFQNNEKYTLFRLKYETQRRYDNENEELIIIESKKGCILRAYIGPWTINTTPRPNTLPPASPFTPRTPQREKPQTSREDPSAVAEQFFKLLDGRDDSAAYRMLDDDFRKFMSLTNFKKLMADMRKTLGARKQKALTFNSSQTVIQGNKYSVVYQLGYTTKFEKGIAQEEIVLRDVDGKLMVDDYKIISSGLKTPERKTPAPGTPETMPEPEQEPEQPQMRGPRMDV